jgi:hypothetical protein
MTPHPTLGTKRKIEDGEDEQKLKAHQLPGGGDEKLEANLVNETE